LQKYLFIIIIFLTGINNFAFSKSIPADDKPKRKKIEANLDAINASVQSLFFEKGTSYNPTKSWMSLMRQVRDAKLQRKQAVDSMGRLTDELYMYMYLKNKEPVDKSEWVFPVRGYNWSAIGGVQGSGYVVADFDFFDNNSGGHPAHDIFINDKNQDAIDDNTNKPVEILSMSGGVVVETRKNWTPEMMDIKGGNIVYVYDNFSDGLFYYAHMNKVYVNVGDFVLPGTVLGIMGRTGKNAYPLRSPTHLHLMYVKNHNGDLTPVNMYDELAKVKSIK
jgi:murein DD-endopeptidase MepM/ murein hydrolase activator NlpD